MSKQSNPWGFTPARWVAYRSGKLDSLFRIAHRLGIRRGYGSLDVFSVYLTDYVVVHWFKKERVRFHVYRGDFVLYFEGGKLSIGFGKFCNPFFKRAAARTGGE